MPHPFQCRCGALRGEITHTQHAVRAACYCRDCQAYAHVLGQGAQVLDANGGTEVVVTQAADVHLTQGRDQLACLSLSPRGLLRWYARCCDTPIANTPRDWRLPYVGMVHSCLHQPRPLEHAFPRVQMRVNTKGAHGTPPASSRVAGALRFLGTALRLFAARVRGTYRTTPFFDGQGQPVAAVHVVDRQALQAARARAAAVPH
ncbi:hypothetical protein H8N03_19140 [Ramlibacter sp. USB13]|uniref:CENP-V/GFA domain-containing protein n=1 Tax=Ramlibacter cellulosilyticus TaxID=2764187 RepID=A0A923MTU5_9BURK|nr:DUF6151 family protein [Ramlibacter cellulosilyticus]MBC5785070.1 hypothetical protein [Ramlibacter cellulosilyticus]